MAVGAEIGALAGAGGRPGALANRPVNTVLPVISGTATENETLSVSNGSWTSDTAITYSYQWRRDATVIGGATNNSYVLTASDIDATLSCDVTATNDEGASTAQSAGVGPVAMALPVNTVLPAITGTTSIGETLSVSDGTWTSTGALSYAYQWERAGTPIAGATSNSYTLIEDDAGHTLTCVVTASNAGGSTDAESAQTAAIQGLVPDSLSFGGTSDYLSMTDADFGAYDRAKFAIACSFYLDVEKGQNILLAKDRISGGGSDYEFRLFTQSGGTVSFATDAGSNGFFNSPSSAYSAGQWVAVLVYYDSANATGADKIRMWINGTEQTAAYYVEPSGAATDTAYDVQIGAFPSSFTTSYYTDGLIHQPTFFSGTLPDPADVFDGTAGKLKDLSGLTGVYSLLDATTATNDAILATDWTNNGTVTTSTSKP